MMFLLQQGLSDPKF